MGTLHEQEVHDRRGDEQGHEHADDDEPRLPPLVREGLQEPFHARGTSEGFLKGGPLGRAMPYQVFEANADAIAALEKDDVTSRQSIVVKDGSAWEIKGKVVIVEGSEEGVKKAEELVAAAGGVVSPKAAAVKAAVDAEAEDSAGGVGFIFG